ncbi:hypothetical protein HDU93_000010 [Gonapodya sp. JEL0774]|nr:hypothetical protein HDU93_000010 [Gonapodya sp. JEL0774]
MAPDGTVPTLGAAQVRVDGTHRRLQGRANRGLSRNAPDILRGLREYLGGDYEGDEDFWSRIRNSLREMNDDDFDEDEEYDEDYDDDEAETDEEDEWSGEEVEEDLDDEDDEYSSPMFQPWRTHPQVVLRNAVAGEIESLDSLMQAREFLTEAGLSDGDPDMRDIVARINALRLNSTSPAVNNPREPETATDPPPHGFVSARPHSQPIFATSHRLTLPAPLNPSSLREQTDSTSGARQILTPMMGTRAGVAAGAEGPLISPTPILGELQRTSSGDPPCEGQLASLGNLDSRTYPSENPTLHSLADSSPKQLDSLPERIADGDHWQRLEKDYQHTIRILRALLEDATSSSASADGPRSTLNTNAHSRLSSGSVRTGSSSAMSSGTGDEDDPAQSSRSWFSIWGSSTEDPQVRELTRQLRRSRAECAELALESVHLQSVVENKERELATVRGLLDEARRVKEEATSHIVAFKEAADEGWREVNELRHRCLEAEQARAQIAAAWEAEAKIRRTAEEKQSKSALELGRIERDQRNLAELNAKLAQRMRELETASQVPLAVPPAQTPVNSMLSILSNVATIVPGSIPKEPALAPPSASASPSLDVEAITGNLRATIATLRSELDIFKRRAVADAGARISVFERDEGRAKERALKEELAAAIERADEWERRWRDTGGLGAEVALERIRDALVECFPRDVEQSSADSVISVEPLIAHIRRAGARWARATVELTESARTHDAQHAKIEELMGRSPVPQPLRVPPLRSINSLPPSLEASQSSVGVPPSSSGRRSSGASIISMGCSWDRGSSGRIAEGPPPSEEVPHALITRREGSNFLARTGSSTSVSSVGPSPFPPSPSLSAAPFPYAPSSYSPTPTDLEFDPPRLATAMRDLSNRYALLQQHSQRADQKLQGQIRANRELKRLIVEGTVGRRKEEGDAILKLADTVSELERVKADLVQERIRVRELEFVVGEMADARADDGEDENTPTEIGADAAHEQRSERAASVVGTPSAVVELASIVMRRDQNNTLL